MNPEVPWSPSSLDLILAFEDLLVVLGERRGMATEDRKMYRELQRAWAELTSPGRMFETQRTPVRGLEVLSYVQAPTSLRDIWLASAVHGDKDYLIYENERISYTQAHERVTAAASALIERGVGPGDRVAIAMRNYPEWMLAYWAVTGIGAVAVGMNAWWVPHEMEYALQDSSPKVLIADWERLLCFDKIRGGFTELAVIAVRPVDKVPVWTETWETLIGKEGQLPAYEIDTDQDACVFYTSGTTGRSKGALLTHRGCVNNILNVAFATAVQTRALACAQGKDSVDTANDTPPRALVATPFFHVTANNCVAQVAPLVGGSLTLMYKWDAAEALRLIEQERITTFGAVPMMTREIVMHPDFEFRDTSSLRTIGGGGAAMTPDLVGKVPKLLPGAKPSTGYGMTETCGIIAAVSLEYLLDRPTSVGPAMPTFEVKCIDSDGNALPVGGIGELLVRGAPVIRGYLNQSCATAEAIVDGWLHTGDIAYLDEDGFIHLVDRAKDMVLRGGENIYCAEVESAIFQHESVAECVAFAVQDERLGEEVGAAIYFKPGCSVDAAELREHCGNYLASFKVPRYLWFSGKPLPRNANGKFVKRELQDTLMIDDAR